MTLVSKLLDNLDTAWRKLRLSPWRVWLQPFNITMYQLDYLEHRLEEAQAEKHTAWKLQKQLNDLQDFANIKIKECIYQSTVIDQMDKVIDHLRDFGGDGQNRFRYTCDRCRNYIHEPSPPRLVIIKGNFIQMCAGCARDLALAGKLNG